MVLLCVGFLFVFFVFLEREKIEGVLKILSRGLLFSQNQIRFRPKKSEKNVSNQSSPSRHFFVIEPSRALTNAPFEHARKHTHKKKKQRDARLPAL